ncbi:MAG: conjugal transfer protein TraX [Oscillospiraceae bacterium]|nr:conjugal transfer protein TraX [Oscillospiraceae bacterium]
MTETHALTGLDRGRLKLLALISMLIDHIGFTIIFALYLDARLVDGMDMLGTLQPMKAKVLWAIYLLCRIIGRLAFPIFAYMLVEGFRHTHSRGKYLGRLVCFAVISEIPYDLVFTGSVFSPKEQNVLWTLAVAVLMLWALEKYALPSESKGRRTILTVIIVALAAWITFWSDNGFGGILLIASIYLFQNKKSAYWIGCIAGLFLIAVRFMWIEFFAVFALLLLEKYNGEKGRDYKYLFYIFYPVHLLVLWLITPLI